jgi:hypothetical protein
VLASQPTAPQDRLQFVPASRPAHTLAWIHPVVIAGRSCGCVKYRKSLANLIDSSRDNLRISLMNFGLTSTDCELFFELCFSLLLRLG